MTGTTVSHYEIQEKLGGGGMGVVFKARDTKLGRTVALKFLPPDLTIDPEARQRFVHEAKAASALDHTNICTIYEIGESDEGQTFIAMAYYEGETLKKKITRGPLPIDEAIDYAKQITRGLEKAHAKGIVHRDIKPANVMVTTDGIVKIVDFGLAKTEDVNLTKTGSTLGTVAYMSPEQARGMTVDQRTDIWSLGIVLFEMLAGERPYEGAFSEAVIYSIFHEEPKPLKTLRQEVSFAIDKVFAQMLQKDVGARYQKIDEVLEELESSKQLSGSVQEYVASKKPRSTSLYLGAFLLITSVIAFAWWMISSDGNSLPVDETQAVPSLAVLPLKNYARNPDQEAYLADGMTMELITTLTRIQGLLTRPSRSVMRFKDTTEPLSVIADSLNVSYVLDGSILVTDDKLRLSFQLIDVDEETAIWVESFDGNLAEVWALQTEVAYAVAREVAVQLTPKEEGRLQKKQSVDPEAYRFYLQGAALRNVDHLQTWIESVDKYEDSIAIDSTFAPAYAGLAKSLGLLALHYPDSATIHNMQFAINRALELDPALSEAYVARGLSWWILGRSFDDAEKDYLRAIELDPGNSSAYYQYGHLLVQHRQFDKAFAMMEKAAELDPLSAISYFGLAVSNFYSGNYEAAIQYCRNALTLEENFLLANWMIGRAYTMTGDYVKALEEFELWGPNLALIYGELTEIYVRSGQRENAFSIVDSLHTRWDKKQLDALYGLAWAYAALGDHEESLNWLNAVYEQQLGIIQYINVEPVFFPLHDHPRFQALVRQIGLERSP